MSKLLPKRLSDHSLVNHLHGPETASQLMLRNVPIAHAEETVSKVLARLRLSGSVFEYMHEVFVLDDGAGLVGTVPLTHLIVVDVDQSMVSIMTPVKVSVPPTMDQEHVASLAILHGSLSVPVVDKNRHFVGVVTLTSLLEVLRHEHVEDLHRLAGIARETSRAKEAIEAPPTRRVRDRMPWLLVGMFGSFFATGVMAAFEQELQANVTIAFFVPAIVYMADAIGTQTEAIAVRGLSLSRISITQLIFSELRVGLMIGLLLGVITVPVIWVAFNDFYLALAVALSLLMASSVAVTIGIILPWLLSMWGKDPAFGSGPIATIIQDVVSLMIYFTIVSWLVI